MTSATSIGTGDPQDGSPETPQSGIDGEEHPGEAGDDDSVSNDDAGHDLTREDIEQGNDRNVSASETGRSGRTNKLDDDGIRLGDT